MSSPSLSSRSEQNHPPTADDPAEWRDPVLPDTLQRSGQEFSHFRKSALPGAPPFALFEGWDSPDADSFRVAQRRGPQRARLWLDGVEGFQRNNGKTKAPPGSPERSLFSGGDPIFPTLYSMISHSPGVSRHLSHEYISRKSNNLSNFV